MNTLASRRSPFEGFTLDAERRQLLRDGREIELRPRSVDVLCCLAQQAGRSVDKQAFFDAVWPRVEASDASLARCVSDIRQALDDPLQRIVKTVPGRGCVLAVPVPPGPSHRAAGDGPRRPAEGPSVSVLRVVACHGLPGGRPREAELRAGLR